MQLSGFDHIVLAVADIETTIAFYTRLLGMEAREERPNKWALHFGANKISLQAADAVPAIAARTTPGSGNFCVLAETPIAELIDRLEAEGIAIVAGPGERIGATGQIHSVYFNDPDGNLVEVSNRL